MLNIKKVLSLILVSLFLLPLQSHAALEIDFEPMLREYPEKIEPISAEALDGQKLDALKKKDAQKMYIIGVMYRDAINVTRDYLQAREWFQKAANLDNLDAAVALARISMLGKEVTGFDTSFDEARKILDRAMKDGSKKAYYSIGELYESGNGYRQSNEKAFDYFKLSAIEGNDVNAYVKLANYYYYGIGIEADKRKTIDALLEVKKRSIDPAVVKYATKTLGQIFFQLALDQKNDSNRFKLFELAWEYRNPLAADALGDLYQKGIGTDRDYKKAIDWYQKSISMDSIYGMEKLGYIYITGPEDIERDYKKAENLFTRGAELGGVNAAYYLGYMYHNGLGIDKNTEEAQKWFKRSEILAERAKRKQQNDEAVYQTFGAGFRDPLKETIDNNEKVDSAQATSVVGQGNDPTKTPSEHVNPTIGNSLLNIPNEVSIKGIKYVSPVADEDSHLQDSQPIQQDPSVPALPQIPSVKQ